MSGHGVERPGTADVRVVPTGRRGERLARGVITAAPHVKPRLNHRKIFSACTGPRLEANEITDCDLLSASLGLRPLIAQAVRPGPRAVGRYANSEAVRADRALAGEC
jgi:hypothetical protein